MSYRETIEILLGQGKTTGEIKLILGCHPDYIRAVRHRLTRPDLYVANYRAQNRRIRSDPARHEAYKAYMRAYHGRKKEATPL